jgi:hypothetical protein
MEKDKAYFIDVNNKSIYVNTDEIGVRSVCGINLKIYKMFLKNVFF